MAAKKTTDTAQADQFEAAVAAGKETVEKAMKAGQEAMEMMNIEKSIDLAKDQVEKARKSFFGNFDGVTEMNTAVFDAYFSSINVVAKGAEAFGKEVADFTQNSIARSVDHGKTVMACKSVNEAVDLQNELVRTSFDQVVAETTKLTEMSVKTANDAFAPIQDQVNQAMTKVFKPVAA